MARQVVGKMDDDLFITGEGGRVFEAKYGVDLGYEMDMSLWGLGLYARLNKDVVVEQAVPAIHVLWEMEVMAVAPQM